LCVGNAKSLLMMLECGSLKVCAFKSSELLHHNIWEVLARNFPGQFAIINKKIKKKERNSDIISKTLKGKGGIYLISKKQL
jgi:hypothetical protein